jgi:2-polyprenyl-3-methyl-5-hydroxy-6-metoxy-1,4-benzoquinol methylase
MNKQNNGERNNSGMEQIWDTYRSTTFNAVNNLNKEEFESISKYYNRIYGKLLPTDKMLKILDMGCGAGHFLYYLDKMGYKNYNGIDISLDQVEFVKTNITEKVEIADAFNYLSDMKEKYDLIVCNDLIEHIRKERLIEIVELMNGALKPNGMVILKTPNMSAPFASISRYIDITHEIGFTEESLTQLLKIGGFQRVDIYPKMGDNGIKRRLSWVGLKLIYLICGRTPPNVLAPNLIELGFK